MPDTTANVLSDLNPPQQPAKRRTKHVGLLGTDAVALYINNADNPLIIDISQEAILGRFTPNQPSQPRVDLMPYGAFEKGVSRMHAVIRRTGSGALTLEDLLSNNGTFLNGVRLPPRVPYQLASSNRIKLGQLEIEIYFGNEAASSSSPAEPITATVLPPAEAPSSQRATEAPAEKITDKAPAAAEAAAGVSTKTLVLDNQTAILTHYHGEVSINPDHVFSEVGQITEEILRRFTNLIGFDVELKLEINVRGKHGFDEPTMRTVGEKSKNLKFKRSDFSSE